MTCLAPPSPEMLDCSSDYAPASSLLIFENLTFHIATNSWPNNSVVVLVYIVDST